MTFVFLYKLRQNFKLHIEWYFSLSWIQCAHQNVGAFPLPTPSSSPWPKAAQRGGRCRPGPEFLQTGCPGCSAESSKIHKCWPGCSPQDTGLESCGVKKGCLAQSIVFQVDLMWKETSIKQLCCTRASYVRVHPWSFLWPNKNVFAFVYYKYIRKPRHLTQNGSWLARPS